MFGGVFVIMMKNGRLNLGGEVEVLGGLWGCKIVSVE